MDHDQDAPDPQGAPIQPERDDAAIVLREHTDDTLCVAASSSNPKCIITGGMDDKGIIWDLELRAPLAKINHFSESVSSVAFSHDGMYAAFATENGLISIVFMDGSEAPASALDGPSDAVNFLAWHPRAPVLLAGSSDCMAYMWNAAKGAFLMAFAGHEDAVSCGAFTADGRLAVTASHDASLRVWSPSTGRTLTRVQVGVDGLRAAFHSADIHCLATGIAETAGQTLVATGCAAGDVFLTQRESAQVVARLPRHTGGAESLAFSPAHLRRSFVASGGADGVVRVWDVEASTERCAFAHGGVVAKVVWHPSKPILMSGASDGAVVLWNVLTASEVVRLCGHEGFITDLCFAGDGGLIASTSADGTVRVFDVRDVLQSVA